jgi:hypothetical protein
VGEDGLNYGLLQVSDKINGSDFDTDDERLKGAITRACASCGGSVVLMEEAAEFVAAAYLADGRS